MLNVNKFYLFCKKYNLYINIGFLLLFFGCLFLSTIWSQSLFSHNLIYKINMINHISNKISIYIESKRIYEFIYLIIITIILFFSLLLEIIFVVIKKEISFILIISIFISIIGDIIIEYIILQNVVTDILINKSYVSAPGMAFYVSLILLIMLMLYKVFMKKRQAYNLLHDCEPIIESNSRKPRPPKVKPLTKAERIAELEKQVEDLKNKE